MARLVHRKKVPIGCNEVESMYEGHWFGGGFMWLFWILVVLVLFWGLKAALSSGGSSSSPHDSRSALDILKERYARGEIDQEEFNQRKRDLLG